ncbi:MAG: hypothetical protein ACR2MQ_16320 [Gemmatimonadaceae bacterium]
MRRKHRTASVALPPIVDPLSRRDAAQGGVILNVLKEAVPSERRSRFWAFRLGVAVYTALLLTL